MKLSIGMMIKNEEKYLEKCLQSLQPLRDAIDSELIIVDTGSEDRSVEIARLYTDKVYFHEWTNNFSEMRNITINYATGDWFFVIDGDEVLEDVTPIINFLKSPDSKKYKAVIMTCKNITDENDPTKFAALITTRLFRKTSNFHYEGAVHNQPTHSGPILKIDASLVHYGYIANDKELMERKFKRTSAILKAELDKNPESIYYWYQLSVTYAMHKDHEDAVKCIETAYQLLKTHDDKHKYMYVYTHMVLLYPLFRRFEESEKVCLESLQIKKGYIDIYFYLAEAQAALGKAEESIKSYQEYLALLTDPVKRVHDTSVVVYTIGQVDIAYYNMANLYKKLENYELALEYSTKITDPKCIQDNLATIAFLYLKSNSSEQLMEHYKKIPESMRDLFLNTIDNVKLEFEVKEHLAIASVFADLENHYGLVSRLILEDSKPLSNETLVRIQQLEMSAIPIYCGEILYYLIKRCYPLHTVFKSFKDVWLDALFNYIAKRHSDLNVLLKVYLEENNKSNSFVEDKVNKALCRYCLQLSDPNDITYSHIFEQYINCGIEFSKKLYQLDVLEHECIHDVKSNEEVFFIYMFQAQKHYLNEPVLYVRYLRKALEVLPIMKNGIEILLAELRENDNSKQTEFDAYKEQVKSTIRQLIDNSKLADARSIINEYKSIVTDDIEVLLMESQLALRETNCQLLN